MLNLKMKAADAANLQKAVESVSPAFSKPDMSETIGHFFFNERLRVYPDYVIYVQRKSIFKNKFEIVCLKIEDIAFFNESNSLKAHRLYFGYHDQIDMQCPKGNFKEELLSYVKQHGAKIGKNVDMVYNSSFRLSKFYNPSYWFTKEQISFNDETLLYHSKTFSSEDTMYIPYSTMTFVGTTNGLFRRRIRIFGEMFCNTKQPFENAVANQIVERVKQYGVQSMASGESFGPSKMWFRWLYTWLVKDVEVIVGEENILLLSDKN